MRQIYNYSKCIFNIVFKFLIINKIERKESKQSEEESMIYLAPFL